MSQSVQESMVLACSQCGRNFSPSDLIQIAGVRVCAECKPAFLSRVMASAAAGVSSAAWRYGGVWMRFGARMIDSFVIFLPVGVIVAVLMPNLLRAGAQASAAIGVAFLLSFVALFIAVGLYEVLMLKNRGATLGKIACGLKVVGSDGRDLSWGTCVGRFFMWHVVTSGIPYLNSVLVLVSAIMAGVDDEKRAIHDRVCDTRVIYKQS